jgi:hypothetical protein
MPRTLSAGLQALIDSGQREDHTCVVITLGNGTVLHFATAELTAGGHFFIGNLGENDPLKMGLTVAVDRTNLKAQNVDKVLGRQLTGISNALEGATAMLAIAFQRQDRTGPIYYDEKMPCDVMTGAVDERWAELPVVGELYSAQVVGDTVSSAFPYQQDAAPTPIINNPDDLPSVPTGSGSSGGPYRTPGRVPIIDLP